MPIPMTCVEEYTSFSLTDFCSWSLVAWSMPSRFFTRKSRPIVDTSCLYLMEEPSSKCAVCPSASTLVTRLLNCCLSCGSVLATAFQIPPVPSRAGNLNVAFGPQLPATFLFSVLEMTILRLGAATRSPSHLHCISVVGTAQTLKLYGRMKRSARPSPIMRRIHSSNVFGGTVARARTSAASTMPSMHFTWSSVGSTEMLFWYGSG